VIAGSLPAGLLSSYDVERRQAARAIVDLAVALGDQIQPTDPAAAAERDALFAQLNTDPAAARAFGADAVAPLSDVRLPQGWFVQDGSGGRMLPQPRVQQGTGEVLLDELLGTGFSALAQPGVSLPAALQAHPLWQALAPTLCAADAVGNATPLAGFIDTEGSGITLVRPDRFVLARLPADSAGAGVLDTLQAMLAPQ
jgi:3-(3-hydroxy-phenyl)propionate hydroxylase